MADGFLVDVATGDVLLVHEDVSRPGVLPLAVGRVYRSSWRAGRWFGPSWASALDQRLQVTPEQVTGVFADGQVLSWRCTADGDGPLPATRLPATRLPVTGPRWRLEPAGHGAFTVTDPQAGLVRRFERRPGYRWTAGGTGELPLVAVTDRAGHQISYEYAETGQPAWVAHSGGYRVRVVMDGGRVAALALAPGEPDQDAGQEVTLVRYGYNPAGELAAVINSADQALWFSYDEEGRLTGWDDRNGICYRYSYDRHGRCVAAVGPDGAMSGTFAYDGRFTRRTDSAGAVTIYQQDESSRIAAVTDPLGNVTHFWHDQFGFLVARADPLGRLTRYSYDERGNLTAVVRPDGSQALAVYDEASQPVRLEAPDRTSWRQEYDPRGRLTRQIAPDGAVTSYGYDERGHLTFITGPLGAVTRVECDPAGLPTAVTAPGGGTTRYTRDLSGRVTEIIGPNGAATQLAWTVEGQLARRVFPDGGSERLDYDAEGNLIARLSPAGERTSYEYGPYGLVTAMTGPDGPRTEFGYDHELRLTSVTHAGLTWRYARDAAGRLVAGTDCNGASTRYSYDQAGQLTSWVNAAARQVRSSYDELGQLIRREADGVVTSFGYDAAGRLVAVTTPDGSTWRYRYDPFGRRIAKQRLDPSGAAAEETIFTWDGPVLAETETGLAEPGGATPPLRFPGQYHDQETGLHYHQQRYYAPVAGSYLTPQPLGLVPASNPHAYVCRPHIQADLGWLHSHLAVSGPEVNKADHGSYVTIPQGASLAMYGPQATEIIPIQVKRAESWNPAPQEISGAGEAQRERTLSPPGRLAMPGHLAPLR
jgi:RHS repeat-associated protein